MTEHGKRAASRLVSAVPGARATALQVLELSSGEGEEEASKLAVEAFEISQPKSRSMRRDTVRRCPLQTLRCASQQSYDAVNLPDSGPPSRRFQSALTSLKQQITLAVRSTMGKQDTQSTSLKKSAHEILVATSTLETSVSGPVAGAMEQLEKVPRP